MTPRVDRRPARDRLRGNRMAEIAFGPFKTPPPTLPQLRELGIIVVFQRRTEARIITIGRAQAASQNKPA